MVRVACAFRIVCSRFFLKLPLQDRFSRGQALRMVRMPRIIPFIRVTRAAILFCAAAAASFAMALAAAAQAPQIAFTWDDLPTHGPLPAGETRIDIGRKIIQAMSDAHVPPVYGFVNGAGLEREPASAPMLKQWRNAGLQLGNHTWSHMNLNTASLADWEADLLKNEPVLEKYSAGADWHWLRYPFLAEGGTPEKRTAARKFLAAHRYRIATVTMSFADYEWNEPYARCVAKNDTAAIAQLESSYLEAASADADFRRAMAKNLFGHDIPYVLLMHVGAFDARMLPRLLKLYSDKGFTFVTLQDAKKDPFYKGSVDPSLPDQPDSLEGAMQAKGMSLPPRPKSSLDLNTICR
jgi:peptidoglycan-N-acetylglucosamine deacetylase